MTPKEKANILHTLMYGNLDNGITWQEAKQCAIIAVDEILEVTKLPTYSINTFTGSGLRMLNGYNYSSYWQEVKLELEKL
jgi:hypothetical protein